MSDARFLVISGLGPDRPGLVAEATWFLTERGANVEDSRAIVLGGEFGLMMLASGAPESLRRITADLGILEHATGLLFTYRLTVSPEEHRRNRAVPYVIEASAIDHEGIVHAITECLYAAGINIVTLDTSVVNAPVTGTPLFRFEAQVDVPDGVSAEEVRSTLNKTAAERNLDIEMRAAR